MAQTTLFFLWTCDLPELQSADESAPRPIDLSKATGLYLLSVRPGGRVNQRHDG